MAIAGQLADLEVSHSCFHRGEGRSNQGSLSLSGSESKNTTAIRNKEYPLRFLSRDRGLKQQAYWHCWTPMGVPGQNTHASESLKTQFQLKIW